MLRTGSFASSRRTTFSYAMPAHADDETAVAEAPAEEEAGPVDDYVELLEGQGEYAPAYDFFTTSMLWTVIAAPRILDALRIRNSRIGSLPAKESLMFSLKMYSSFPLVSLPIRYLDSIPIIQVISTAGLAGAV